MKCRSRTRRRRGAAGTGSSRSIQAERPLHTPVRLDPLEGRILFSTYTVTTLSDAAGSVTPTGSGAFNATTLRAALNATNAHAGSDTVKFASGLTGTVNLNSALPQVSSPLTLTGPGASKITVRRSAGAATQFTVFANLAGVTSSISGLRISNGTASRVNGVARGGGVVNFGSLTISACTLADNRAAGSAGVNATFISAATPGHDGLGGAIYNTGSLTLNSCTLSGNTAIGGVGGHGVYPSPDFEDGAAGGDGRGGAVYNTGKLTLNNSTLSGNHATGGDGGVGYNAPGGTGAGGAVDSPGGNSTVTITGCTLSGNTAKGGSGSDSTSSQGLGGAVESGGGATLVRATLSGNTAAGGSASAFTEGKGSGGGLVNLDGGKLTLNQSTLSGNHAIGNDEAGIGGGLVNHGTATITGSVLSANVAVGGDAPGDAFVDGLPGMGGGVYSDGSLTMAVSTLSGNTAVGGNATYSGTFGSGTGGAAYGGGLDSQGSATLTECTLSGNHATGGDGMFDGPGGAGAGGGALNGGVGNVLTLTRCTLSGNTATGGSGEGDSSYDNGGSGGGGAGGGVFNGDGSRLTVTGTTVSGNNAVGGNGSGGELAGFNGIGGHGDGAGVYNSGTATLTNSTVSGNHVSGGTGGVGGAEGGFGGSARGGGIYDGEMLTLTQVTVANNSAAAGRGSTAGGNGATGQGGGIFSNVGGSELNNTLVALNTASTSDPDVSGAFVSGPGGAGGHNLIGNVGSATGFTSADRVGGHGRPVIDPKLATLADNGGPTLTMALKPGSPAIDAGSDALAVNPDGTPLTTDQRGTGFPRKKGAHVDIGAFEQPAAGTMLTLNGTSGNDSIVVTLNGAGLTINENGRVSHRGAFEFAGFVLNGGGGDDYLFLDKAITLPFTLNGGDGNDLLHPGGGPGDVIGGAGTDTADYSDNTAGVSVSADGVRNDGPAHDQNVHADVEMILGGSGNDTLTGSTLAPNLLAGNGGNDVLHGLGNRDVLIGGNGKDQLFGDSADDLLIDSRTVYDGNVLFLRTLRFEWQNPANDYATRINRLKAGVLGVKITAANLPNDNAADTLTGGTGRDWFVFHAGDFIADKAADETATQL